MDISRPIPDVTSFHLERLKVDFLMKKFYL